MSKKQNLVHHPSCQVVRCTAYLNFFYGRTLNGPGLGLDGRGLGLLGLQILAFSSSLVLTIDFRGTLVFL